jgi:regulator of protease activity HflC (stomatin/prohibitin superfamily)
MEGHMIREIELRPAAGIPVVLGLIPAQLASLFLLVAAVFAAQPAAIVLAALLVAFVAFLFAGFFMVNPNEARVMQLFGRYVGSARQPGLRWANPLLTKKKVSLRVVSFESGKLKVNDLDGNPVEIAAIVVWKVVDSAEAVFAVDDFHEYVRVQSEAALRNLATRYPYDAHDDEKVSLRGSTGVVAEHLEKEVQDRAKAAGVQVLEARISHLAYAPEIAQAMLQRQQAAAIIAARTRIVEGAVSMVEMALDRLQKAGTVHLDEERKAAMVSNLLVVLCGDRSAHPVINTGTLY